MRAVLYLMISLLAVWAATPNAHAQAPKPDAPAVPKITEAKHGDWIVRCRPGCEIYQLLRGRSGDILAEFRLTKLPPGGSIVAGVIVFTPPGTSQEHGVVVVVGDHDNRYPTSQCTEAGCRTRLGITEELLAAFRLGDTATVAFSHFTTPNKPVNLPLSLKGFTSAFKALGK